MSGLKSGKSPAENFFGEFAGSLVNVVAKTLPVKQKDAKK
jgi:hypothetical protein